jgi:hypothetical protein
MHALMSMLQLLLLAMQLLFLLLTLPPLLLLGQQCRVHLIASNRLPEVNTAGSSVRRA